MKTTFSNIYKLLSKHRVDLLYLLIIIILSLLIRLFLINTIPLNITGDESWDLSHVYRIVYGNDVHPITLLGDGSVFAIVFYPVAYLIKMFGTENSIFFLRLNIIIYSLLSLIAFYHILKQETSRIIAFSFTLILSANYVFLNFSRTAWVNMISICSGLFLILFLEKARTERRNFYYLVAGIFGGIGFYAYHFGRVLTMGIVVYLILNIITDFNKQKLRGFAYFILSLVIVLLPFIYTITQVSGESVVRRPKATFAFSQENLSKTPYFEILSHQLTRTFRGFIILDGKVMSEGFENLRYLPVYSPPVNLTIKVLFVIGLIFFLVKKRKSIWLFVLGSILVVQIISVVPPNYSRGLFYLPFIYFITGFFVYNIIKNVENKFKIRKKIIYSILIIISLLIFSLDLIKYFSWMNDRKTYDYRQPAIIYEEFSKWQDYQIELIKNGGYPIVNQQWYIIRNSL